MKKNEVNNIISHIVKKYNINSKILGEDSIKIFELLELCPKLNYIKSEYYYLYVSNYKIPGRNIKMIFATDGRKKIPLSKSKIINELFPPKINKVSYHINNVKKAARNIIKNQISNFREGISLPLICPLSHKKLTNWKLIHVDHKIPFSILFSNWLDENRLSPLDIKLKGGVNNKTFADINLTNNWYLYHQEKSILQCVHYKANLEKSNKLY